MTKNQENLGFFVKNNLSKLLDEKRKEGFYCKTETAKRLGCQTFNIKNKIGDPSCFMLVGTKTYGLYHEKQIQAYLNRGKCVNCEE